MENINLLALRVKSGAWTLVSMLIMAIAAYIVSPEFLTVLQDHTGSAMWGSLLVLLVPEIIKHIRNKIVIGRATKKFGSAAPLGRIDLF